MSTHGKAAQQFARQLFRISLEDGEVSPDRVTGVLEYVEKHRPPNPVMILKAYRHLIAAELARGQAVVEHAGPLANAALQGIAATLARRYGRRVAGVSRPNPALIAGVRVHIGDDVYETSVAGQLAALASAV